MAIATGGGAADYEIRKHSGGGAVQKDDESRKLSKGEDGQIAGTLQEESYEEQGV